MLFEVMTEDGAVNRVYSNGMEERDTAFLFFLADEWGFRSVHRVYQRKEVKWVHIGIPSP